MRRRGVALLALSVEINATGPLPPFTGSERSEVQCPIP